MRQTRKSSLFLMELIIAILFFSLSAAVCVQLFATAYRISAESTYRDAATLQAQSMAALFCAADGELDAVLTYTNASEVAGSEGEYIGNITLDNETYTVALFVENTSAASAATIAAGTARILTIEITAPSAGAGDAPIITLTTKVYQPLQVQEVA